MNITAIITAIAGAIVVILSFLFNHEKCRRQEAEEKADNLQAEAEAKAVELEAEITAGDQEQATSEAQQEIIKKVDEAIKGIHDSIEEDQIKIYNEKIRGWKQYKR